MGFVPRNVPNKVIQIAFYNKEFLVQETISLCSFLNVAYQNAVFLPFISTLRMYYLLQEIIVIVFY